MGVFLILSQLPTRSQCCYHSFQWEITRCKQLWNHQQLLCQILSNQAYMYFKTSSVSLSCHHAKVDSRLSLNIAAREPTIIGVDSNPSCSKFVSQFEIFNSSKPSDSNHLYHATFINKPDGSELRIEILWHKIRTTHSLCAEKISLVPS